MLMPIAIPKSAAPLLSILAIFLFGCSDPTKKRTQQLEQIDAWIQSGDYTEAEASLQQIAQNHPEDISVWLAITDLHKAQGQTTQAALALQKAQRLAPDNAELLLRTAEAQLLAGLPVRSYLEMLAELAPQSMDPALWEKLGASRAEAQQTQAALDAYLEATNIPNYTPTAEIATAIGQLFLQLDNLPQAERWFNAAAESDELSALSALFGLLKIHQKNTDWPKAELILAQLQEQFPGSVEASHWANLPLEIKEWRAAQETLQAQMAEANQPASTTDADTTAGEIGSDQTATQADTEVAGQSSASDSGSTQPAEGKEAALADLDAAIAMADKPAIEVDLIPEEDPQIEPAAPQPPDPAQLIEDARIAEQERDYTTAIQLYWQALAQANESSEIWSRLAQAYQIDGQMQNAETAALESLRLNPEKEEYMLDYLRIIQRTQRLPEFLQELRSAYERFPTNPDIVLSLARAYERIGDREEAAANAYQRFIQLAPGHILRPEAEAALNRLL